MGIIKYLVIFTLCLLNLYIVHGNHDIANVEISNSPMLNVSSTHEVPVGINTMNTDKLNTDSIRVYPTVAGHPESSIPKIPKKGEFVISEASVLPTVPLAVPTKEASIPVNATVKAEWVRTHANVLSFIENDAEPSNASASTVKETTKVKSSKADSTVKAPKSTNSTSMTIPATNIAPSGPLDPKPVDDSDIHFESSNSVSFARFALELNRNEYIRDPAGFIKTMRVELADALKAPIHRIEVASVDPFGMYVELKFVQPTLDEVRNSQPANSEYLVREFIANAASKNWANYTIISRIDNRVKLYHNTTVVIPEKVKPIKAQVRLNVDASSIMSVPNGLEEFVSLFISEISGLTGLTSDQIFVHSVYPEHGVSLDVLIVTFELRGIESPSLFAYVTPINAYARLTRSFARDIGLSSLKLLSYADRKFPLLSPAVVPEQTRWSENTNAYQVARLKPRPLRKLVRPVVIPTLIVGEPVNMTAPSRDLPV